MLYSEDIIHKGQTGPIFSDSAEKDAGLALGDVGPRQFCHSLVSKSVGTSPDLHPISFKWGLGRLSILSQSMMMWKYFEKDKTLYKYKLLFLVILEVILQKN